MTTLFLTEVGGDSAQGFMAAWEARGREEHLVVTDTCDVWKRLTGPKIDFMEIPKTGEVEITRALMFLREEFRHLTLVPCGRYLTSFIVRNDMASWFDVEWTPDKVSALLVHDKKHLAERFPDVWVPTSDYYSTRFCFAKPIDGSGSRGCIKLDREVLFEEPYVYTEFIEGVYTCVDFAWVGGEFVWTSREVTRQRGGADVILEFKPLPDASVIAREIALELGLPVGNVQMIRQRDTGKLFVIDIASFLSGAACCIPFDKWNWLDVLLDEKTDLETPTCGVVRTWQTRIAYE